MINRIMFYKLLLLLLTTGFITAPTGASQTMVFHQTSPSPADAPAWSFVMGVPMARGVLTDAKNARILDNRGQEIPAQIEPLTYWSPSRDSIKWLRVAFTAPSVKGKAPEYQLEFGKDVAQMKVQKPVKVTETDDGVTVDTGMIRFTLNRNKGGNLSTVIRAGVTIYKALALDGPYVQDDKGTSYQSANDKEPIITIEESGPIRSVVRVENWNVSEDGKARLNKNVTRYYAYSGQPYIQMDWSFVITADTDLVRFKDIGLRVGNTQQSQLGLADGKKVNMNDGYLLQKKADAYVVRRKYGQGYEEIRTGQKAPGWVSSANLAITMRDFWQMFPKELEVQPSTIVLHAWPSHGEYNADWFQEPEQEPSADATPNQISGANGVKLDVEYFSLQQKWHHGPLLDFHYPDWWRRENITGTAERPGWLSKAMGGERSWENLAMWHIPNNETVKEIATGTSRTQQLLLDFSGENEGNVAAHRSIFLAEPHIWLKDPEQLAQSKALGPLDVQVADSWDEASLKSWEQADKVGYYGMWVWGNMPEYFSPASGLPGLYRQMNGGPHYGYFNTHWLLYLCTGNPEDLRYARVNTAHWRDVGIVHYSTSNSDIHDSENQAEKVMTILGASHSLGFYPWRSGNQFSFYSGVAPLLMDYYLTGDRLSLETADLHIHAMFQHTSLTGYSREFGASFKTYLDWYAHSWDPVFGKAIDDGIDWIVTNDPTTTRGKESTPLNWQNFMGQYLDLTENPDVPLKHRDKLLGYVEKWNEEWIGTPWSVTGYAGNPGNMLAAAWFATGDTKYLQPFQRNVFWDDMPRGQWFTPKVPGLGSGMMGPIYFDQVLYAYAAWRQASEMGLLVSNEKDLPPPPSDISYRAPLGETATGNGVDFLILKEAGKPWRIRLKASGGVPNHLTIFSADETKYVDLILQDEGWSEYGLPADAPAGVYQMQVRLKYGYGFTVIPEDKHVINASQLMRLQYGSEWKFLVPKGTREFIVEGKNIMVLDPTCRKMADITANEQQTITVPAGADGKLWSIRTPLSSAISNTVRLEGIPPYLAAHEEYWFPANK